MLKKGLADIYRTDTAVELDGVTKQFTQLQRNTGKGLLKGFIMPEKKSIKALDEVSFKIHKGEFVAYAGPNGAGKSTTMKLLAGMLVPSEGRLSVLGMSPSTNRIPLMRKLGVLFGNRTELWWDHPILQSFEWKKAVWNIPNEVYKRNLKRSVELLDIGELLKTFARELSLGQRMRADLAMMLLHSPELILLDEPTLGLDVVAKRQMIEFLKEINRENGVTIVVTSHDMDDLEEMAERILMISGGKITFDGSFEGLRDISGNLSRIRITTNYGRQPDLPIGKFVCADKDAYEYDLDLSQTSVNELLFVLSKIEGIQGIEIKKVPIEQVIVGLYQSWKNKQPG